MIEATARHEGFETLVIHAVVDVLDAIDMFQPTAILADLAGSEGEGPDVLAHIAKSGTGALIVVMTKYPRAAKIITETLELTIAGVLVKPLELHRLRWHLRALMSASAVGTRRTLHTTAHLR
ncbi:MAG TPA: hypothetical protein VF175_18025 [Lacipirellula sp.]|jgi:DNA-binding response OmpR family regulator